MLGKIYSCFTGFFSIYMFLKLYAFDIWLPWCVEKACLGEARDELWVLVVGRSEFVPLVFS